MASLVSAKHPWNFKVKNGDIRCIGYIINLSVQAALTQLKATLSKTTESYCMEQRSSRSYYSKLRRSGLCFIKASSAHLHL
jgi:hypothetical protein